MPISDVAKRLNARYIVQGSIRRTQNKIRVSVHLIEAASEAYVWGEQYDGALESIFTIQDDITAQAVSALAVQIEASERERVGHTPPTVFRAYEWVLRGQQHLSRYAKQENAEARRFFDAALQADPTYARAYASISRSHNLDWRYGWSESPNQSLDTALTLAQASIGLDPDDARGHAEFGFVKLYKREHDAAIAAYERAKTLNPNDADILAELGVVLTHSGCQAEALDLFRRAMRLNPLHPDEYLWYAAGAFFHLRQYEDAIRTVHRMRNMSEGRRLLAASYAHLGCMEAARREADLVRQCHPDITARSWVTRVPNRFPESTAHLFEGLRKAGL